MSGPRSVRAGWPAGLLGAVALIAAVEAFVASHPLDFISPSRMEWRESRRASSAEATGRAVLALGTSMMKLGLYSAVVEREAGRGVYNLACSAGRIPGSYFLLKRALDAGSRPEAVLLEVHPTYMDFSFNYGTTAWPDQLGPAECLELAWSARDASFLAHTMMALALPSYRDRFEIRSAILGAFNGESNPNGRINRTLLRNLGRNDGAFVNHRVVPYAGEVSDHLANLYLRPTWRSQRLNERYLRRLLRLCDANRIKVFWLIPPFAPTLQDLRERVGHDAAYTEFVNRYRRDFPGMIVLDARWSGYPSDEFFDAAHLDYPGAVAFSAEVGRMLKAGLDRPWEGPRWVDLPDYHRWPTESPLEDMAQSALALDQADSVRR